MGGYINSEQSTFLLNVNDKLLDKEVPKTNKENSSLLPVSLGVDADDIHLLNNIEREGN